MPGQLFLLRQRIPTLYTCAAATLVTIIIITITASTTEARLIGNSDHHHHHHSQGILRSTGHDDDNFKPGNAIDVDAEEDEGEPSSTPVRAMFLSASSSPYKEDGGPQNINFTSCSDGSPAPTSLVVTCTERVRKTCALNRGENHTVVVRFTPRRSSSRVVSSVVSWRTWLEMPLPEQDEAACNYMGCPLQKGVPTTFSYKLNMPSYIMRRRYSLIWRLTDVESGERLLCFSFRTHVT